MNAQFFEDITKQIGRSTTRREMLVILSGTLWGSFMVSTFGSCKKDEKKPPSDPDDPPSNGDEFSIEILTPDQTQQLLASASQDLHHQGYETLLATAGTYQLVKTEGALWKKKGQVTTRTIVSHYQDSSSTASSYLVYGTDGLTPITVLLRSETDTNMVVSMYNNGNGSNVELFKSTSPPPNTTATPNSSYADVCKMCLDTCKKTNLLQPEFCIGGIISAAIQTGTTFGKVWQALHGPGVADAARTVAIAAVVNSGNKLQSCVKGTPIDCDNGMCRDICNGCNSTNTTCSERAICIGGKCRQPCDDRLCQATETCLDGTCIPINDPCPSPQLYMGEFRTADKDTTASFCCPFAGTNCKATVDGFWGGCCPAGLKCGAVGKAFGCCIPGRC